MKLYNGICSIKQGGNNTFLASCLMVRAVVYYYIGVKIYNFFFRSGTFPASEYLFSAPWTPLCHFDKLEGQREQPGDSANLSL